MKANSYQVSAIGTDLLQPGQNLGEFVARHLTGDYTPRDGLVLAVTSKIVSLAEGRLVPTASITKKELVQKEADVYLGDIGYGCYLTIKHGLLIPSAGIDESNSGGTQYILYPEKPFESARLLHRSLSEEFGIKNLGIILTDSHTTPLRRGVTGIALAYWGMRGVRNLVGKPDLFGKPLQYTRVNIVDALAAAAVLAMGEADERRPLALIEGADVEFVSNTDPKEVEIPLEEDLYRPMLLR